MAHPRRSEDLKTPLGELIATSFTIGCLSFGGPAAQIALMHRIFVEEKKWISEERYLHALNYCMLLPGPEAQQLATYVGWTMRGVTGGMIAGGLFVLPGALVILVLSWIYGIYGALPVVAAAFVGVKAAVIAFIAEALFKVSKRALRSKMQVAVAILAFLALFLFGASFPLVILSAGLFGAILHARFPASNATPIAHKHETLAFPKALRAAGSWVLVWIAPLALSFLLLGPNHILSRVGVLFAKLAVVTFGGAYSVLAYLQQQAVEVEGWLSAAQMIDGLGLAETTPGPLVLVNQFVGFMAGWQADHGGIALAIAAAMMASWQTFAPSFVWIFAGAPFADRLRSDPRVAAALAAITAAVLGVIAQLGFLFASHVLFAGRQSLLTPWGRAILVPDISAIAPGAMLIAGLAGFALIRLKLNPVIVVALGVAMGVMLAQFGI
jgi:chromate transporter